jgi:hypothetical protein
MPMQNTTSKRANLRVEPATGAKHRNWDNRGRTNHHAFVGMLGFSGHRLAVFLGTNYEHSETGARWLDAMLPV